MNAIQRRLGGRRRQARKGRKPRRRGESRRAAARRAVEHPVTGHSHPSASSSSTGSLKLQLPIETKRVRRRGRDLVGACLAVAPAEGVAELERLRVVLGKRTLLVAEDGRGEKVEEPELAVRANGVVEPGRRLEGDPLFPAGPDEAGELVHRRRLRTAAHLGARPDSLDLFQRHALEVGLAVPAAPARDRGPRSPRPGRPARPRRRQRCSGASARHRAPAAAKRGTRSGRPSTNAATRARAGDPPAPRPAGSEAGGKSGAWSISPERSARSADTAEGYERLSACGDDERPSWPRRWRAASRRCRPPRSA